MRCLPSAHTSLLDATYFLRFSRPLAAIVLVISMYSNTNCQQNKGLIDPHLPENILVHWMLRDAYTLALLATHVLQCFDSEVF